MTNPCIITTAITGAIPRTSDCPALPVIPSQQIESTHEAYEAGSALVHIHVRNDDETPSSNADKFLEVQEGVRKHCSGMIIQFSTGGRGRDQNTRGAALEHSTDMASLSTGSVNFPNAIYENPPEFIDGLATRMLKYNVKPEIEVFDAAMLYNAASMVKRGLLKEPVHVQFVMGIPNAMPARRSILEFLLAELPQVLPSATWTAAGIGRHQFEVNKWCLELGGHCRTGLEDNIKFDRTRVAISNAELVKKIVDIAGDYDRAPATPEEARALLSLS